MKKSAIILFLALFACDPVKAPIHRDLDRVSPEAVGFSSERLTRIDDVIGEYISDKKIPGAVVRISRHGKTVYSKAYGMSDVENNIPMREDHIFRIASQTKAITSVALMMLYEQGKFLLDDPVSTYIPEFANTQILEDFNEETGEVTTRPAEKEITIRQLLNHTSGIAYGFMHPTLSKVYANAGVIDGLTTDPHTLSEIIPKLGQQPVLFEPGSRWLYGLNTDVVGYLVEVLSGQPLDEFFSQHIFQPLGMVDTYFYLPPEKHERLTSLYFTGENGFELSEIPEGDNYPIEGSMSYFSGGAGLVSTADDYSRFMEMLLNGGSFNGAQILGRKTIDLMTTNQTGELGTWRSNPFGLGFEIIEEDRTFVQSSSAGNFSWGGIFNTSYWMDKEEDLSATLMLQIYPFSHGEIHDKFKVLVYQALVD